MGEMRNWRGGWCGFIFSFFQMMVLRPFCGCLNGGSRALSRTKALASTPALRIFRLSISRLFFSGSLQIPLPSTALHSTFLSFCLLSFFCFSFFFLGPSCSLSLVSFRLLLSMHVCSAYCLSSCFMRLCLELYHVV